MRLIHGVPASHYIADKAVLKSIIQDNGLDYLLQTLADIVNEYDSTYNQIEEQLRNLTRML